MIWKFEIAVTLGMNPFKNVPMTGLECLEIATAKNKTIIKTPNTRLVLSEIIAALISAFCWANSKRSKADEVWGWREPGSKLTCEWDDNGTFRASDVDLIKELDVCSELELWSASCWLL